jgi:N-acetylglucosaminyldiphosphoundecaprenol N-acetyl-beta-D-mannosaminyltransferase
MRETRRQILGMPVDAIDMDRAMVLVDRSLADGGRRLTVLAMNPEKVFALEKDPVLRKVFHEAYLVLPDGIGVVAALRFLHGTPVGRVPGADLMQRLCGLAALRGYRVFLFGASEEVNAGAAAELIRRNPGLLVVGRQNGYLPDNEMEAFAARINEAQPDLLFVALGSPRQELWMQRWLPELDVGICQGIGGTLDTIVGTVKRAPLLFQKTGLEWFYRLASQPSRAKRQIRLPIFALRVVAARFKKGEE